MIPLVLLYCVMFLQIDTACPGLSCSHYYHSHASCQVLYPHVEACEKECYN